MNFELKQVCLHARNYLQHHSTQQQTIMTGKRWVWYDDATVEGKICLSSCYCRSHFVCIMLYFVIYISKPLPGKKRAKCCFQSLLYNPLNRATWLRHKLCLNSVQFIQTPTGKILKWCIQVQKISPRWVTGNGAMKKPQQSVNNGSWTCEMSRFCTVFFYIQLL